MRSTDNRIELCVMEKRGIEEETGESIPESNKTLLFQSLVYIYSLYNTLYTDKGPCENIGTFSFSGVSKLLCIAP